VSIVDADTLAALKAGVAANARLNNLLGNCQLSAFKTTTEGRSATTPTGDADLQYPVQPNSHYFYVMFLNYQGGATPNDGQLVWYWSLPAGAGGNRYCLYQGTGLGLFTQTWGLNDSSPTAGTNGISASRIGLMEFGSFDTAASGGIAQLMWSKRQTTNTLTSIVQGSQVMAWMTD
jgi:hypothetical protein